MSRPTTSEVKRAAVLAYVKEFNGCRLSEICRHLFGSGLLFTAVEDAVLVNDALTRAGWRVSEVSEQGRHDYYYQRPGTADFDAPPPQPGPMAANDGSSKFSLIESPTTAVTILQDASSAVIGRADSRDVGGERSMPRAVEAFNALTGHRLTERDGWLLMVQLKAARATAGNHTPDDYVDGAAYFALAGERAAADAEAAHAK